MKNKQVNKKKYSNNLVIILTIIGMGVAIATVGTVYGTLTTDEDLIVNGNIGIKTTPNSELDVAGTIRAQIICDELGDNCADISAGGLVGPQGETGLTGETGSQGIQGEQGPSGNNAFSVLENNAYYTNGINTSLIQNRVTGSCDVGSSISAINEDGTVSCETDDEGSSEYVLVKCTGSRNAYCNTSCSSGWTLISDLDISSYGYWTGIGLCRHN